MRDQRKYPTKDEILEKLDYNPDTGVFTKKHNWGRPTAGNVAGRISNNGYRYIGIHGQQWLAHRLAWIICTGNDTTLTIDHINGIRLDNRISNLREADRVTQGRNKALLCNNESGIMGVYRHSINDSWSVQIGINGKRVYIGSFPTLHEARAARFAAEKVIGFHENHGRHPNPRENPLLNPLVMTGSDPPPPPDGGG